MPSRVSFIDQIVISHPAFDDGLEALRSHLELAIQDGKAHLAGIFGDSGAGKSHMLKVLLNKGYATYRTNDGLVVPKAIIEMPARATPQAFLEETLAPYDVEDVARSTEGQLKRRVVAMVKNCQTKVLAIEEIQHLAARHSEKTALHVADLIKVVHDKVPCLLVLTGLIAPTKAFVERSEQINTRMVVRIELPRFDWSDKKSKAEFTQCLKQFNEKIVAQGWKGLPKLNTGEWPYRIFCATGGVMRVLANLLKEVLANCAYDKEIGLTDFSRAYKVMRAHPDVVGTKLPPPFDANFLKFPVKEALAQAALVGADRNPKATQYRPRKRGR